MQPGQDWTRTEPEHWRFGGGASETVLHPIVLVAMLATIVVLLWRPRRIGLVAFLLSTFLIPAGQQLLIGGVHIFVYRIIVMAGLIRMIQMRSSRSTLLAGGWNSLDTVFMWYVCLHAIAFISLNYDSSAIVNQVGFIWDYVGGYLLLRYLIQDDADVTQTIRCFACLVILLAVCMIREQLTGQNIFGILGGVRLSSQIREGRIRSEAVFQHAILAGTFGATLLPLFIWLWKTGKARLLSIAGIVGATVMTLASACSTPIGTYAAGLIAVCFWPLRRSMRTFRWGLGISLILLHIVMKAPVWALIERIDIVQGSSSYHRYELVNQFIRHWSEWWFIGTKTNAEWGDLLFDASNQYVADGISGGIFALTFFISQICYGFSRVARGRKAIERKDRQKALLLWCLGASLFAHVIAFFGIDYFDQIRVSWFALLAMICAATAGLQRLPSISLTPQVSESRTALSVSGA
jgi:hypothetical protein